METNITLYLFIFICLLANSFGGFSFGRPPKVVEIQPLNPKACSTENLTLTCTRLNNDTSKSLMLQVNNDNIPDEEITIIDNKTISYTMTNLNATQDHNTNVLCCLGPCDFSSKDAKIIQVYDKPKPVENFRCVVHNYLDSMTCDWDLVVDPSPMRVILNWKHQNFLSWNFCASHSDDDKSYNKTSCTWKSTSDGDFSLKTLDFIVTVISECGESVSSNYTIDTSDIVKPLPVDNLRATVLSSRCINVSWEPGNRAAYVKHYEIYYTSKWDIETLHVIRINDTEAHKNEKKIKEICGLHPYTDYTFTVRAHPEGQGYWSDNTTITAKTYSDIPSASPRIIEGAFKTNYKECETSAGRHVTVYWRPLKEIDKNGEIEAIVFSTNEPGTWPIHLGSKVTHYTVGLDCTSAYSVTVQAMTINGTSLQPSTIQIPVASYGISCPEFRVEMANTTNDISRDVYIKCPSVSDDGVLGATVFWCEKQAGECNSAVQWKEFSKSMEVLVLPMTSPESYLYGISIETETGSSGLSKWESRIYIRDVDKPKPVENFRCVVHNYLDSMTCDWDLVVDPRGMRVILDWKIHPFSSWNSCPSHNNDDKSDNKTSCTWKSTSDGNFSLKTLDFNVTVISDYGESASSNYTIDTSDIVKPLPVDDLIATGGLCSRCVTVAWNPSRGAFVKRYDIYYNSIGDNGTQHVIQMNDTDVDKNETKVKEICDLHPFTDYTFTVRAHPKAPSTAPGNVKVRPGNEDNTLSVTWASLTCERYIHKYIIQYCRVDKLNHCVTDNKTVEVPAKETLYIIKDLEEDKDYSIQMRAVTKVGMLGPLSKSVIGVPELNSLTIAEISGIACGAIVGFMFITAGAIWMIRNCYQRGKRKFEPPKIKGIVHESVVDNLMNEKRTDLYIGMGDEDVNRGVTEPMLQRQTSTDSRMGDEPLTPTASDKKMGSNRFDYIPENNVRFVTDKRTATPNEPSGTGVNSINEPGQTVHSNNDVDTNMLDTRVKEDIVTRDRITIVPQRQFAVYNVKSDSESLNNKNSNLFQNKSQTSDYISHDCVHTSLKTNSAEALPSETLSETPISQQTNTTTDNDPLLSIQNVSIPKPVDTIHTQMAPLKEPIFNTNIGKNIDDKTDQTNTPYISNSDNQVCPSKSVSSDQNLKLTPTPFLITDQLPAMPLNVLPDTEKVSLQNQSYITTDQLNDIQASASETDNITVNQMNSTPVLVPKSPNASGETACRPVQNTQPLNSGYITAEQIPAIHINLPHATGMMNSNTDYITTDLILASQGNNKDPKDANVILNTGYVTECQMPLIQSSTSQTNESIPCPHDTNYVTTYQLNPNKQSGTPYICENTNSGYLTAIEMEGSKSQFDHRENDEKIPIKNELDDNVISETKLNPNLKNFKPNKTYEMVDSGHGSLEEL